MFVVGFQNGGRSFLLKTSQGQPCQFLIFFNVIFSLFLHMAVEKSRDLVQVQVCSVFHIFFPQV